MPASTDVFNDVVHYLENHEESLRIKKLIFCLCKKYWENDNGILNSVSLSDLVQELIQVKPSNGQLTFSVYKLVKTLNRPKVYAGVATVIIDQVSKLYNNMASAYETQVTSIEREPQTRFIQKEPRSNVLVQQIVNEIENNSEQGRIKKLMFAACKNRWENELSIIDDYGMKNLIEEIQNQNPNLQTLRKTLNKIADNINKRALYMALAEIIVGHLEPLYDTEVEYDKQITESRGNNQIVHLDNGDGRGYRNRQKLDEKSLSTSVIDVGEPQVITELHVAETERVMTARKDYDPFEIRLEIFQYTNPLRVKILLFSLLFHPWDKSDQDWSTLRSYTLEDLLEQLIQTNISLSEIEQKLTQIAKYQVDADDYMQTVSVLLQVFQRIF